MTGAHGTLTMKTYNENLQLLEDLVESKSPLIPEVAIDTVLRNHQFQPGDKGTGQVLRDYLTHHLVASIQHTPKFLDSIIKPKGNAGRDFVYMWLGHWLQGAKEALERDNLREYLARHEFSF